MKHAAWIIVAAGFLSGCASGGRPPQPAIAPVGLDPRPGQIAVWSGQYGAAFDAARRTLRDSGFILERVDSHAGVITTAPKGTAGLATPWDLEQSTAGQELEDLAQRHRRVVRVAFEPLGRSSETPAPEADLNAYEGDLAMRVEVVVERVHAPGWRLDTNDIRASTYTVDPQLAERVRGYPYVVAATQDTALAERLAQEISRRIWRETGETAAGDGRP